MKSNSYSFFSPSSPWEEAVRKDLEFEELMRHYLNHVKDTSTYIATEYVSPSLFTRLKAELDRLNMSTEDLIALLKEIDNES